MKNRLFAVPLLLLLLFVLAGCGGSTGSTGSTTSTAVDSAGQIDLAALPTHLDVQTVASLQTHEDVFLLDVREPWEYNEGHIPNITLIPMNDITGRLAELPTDKTIIVTCRSGNRSNQVTNLLRAQGFTNVHNMQGGILAWQAAGLPVEK